jgi:hypothetical protein
LSEKLILIFVEPFCFFFSLLNSGVFSVLFIACQYLLGVVYRQRLRNV